MSWKTAESVTEGHPDKVCDQIADAVLDEYLKRDTMSRVAVEVFGSHGMILVGGEVTSTGEVDAEAVARRVYTEVGYNDEVDVLVHLTKQSPDIAQGVDMGGAGDQGIMYGYATAETPEFLPAPIAFAHALTRRLADLRKHDPACSWLRPDGKAQVTMEGARVRSVVVSTQHSEDIVADDVEMQIRELVVAPVIGKVEDLEILVNPTGRFVTGGFSADTGLTGRKIMVDTYGGLLPHGGGAFSGKDPSKVDRSASYMCRYVAKSIVANGLAKNVLVSVAYAIGRAEPMMLTAKTGEGRDLSAFVRTHFDFRPQAIIERLGLRRPIYRATAAYGHFGKSGLPWEEIAPL